MSSKLGPLAALAMVTLISAGCSSAPAEIGTGNNTAANHEKGDRQGRASCNGQAESYRHHLTGDERPHWLWKQEISEEA
jgi:hypothetical protein